MPGWFKKEDNVSPYKKAFVLVVMAITLMIVLISSKPMITKTIAENNLKAFSDYISAHAKESGKEASFTYQDIHMHGLAQSAEIIAPSLTFSDSSAPGATKTTFSTARMIMVPVRRDGLDYMVQFPSPITMTDIGGRVTQLQFDGVPAYGFGARRGGDGMAYAHQVRLPPKFTLSAITAGTGAMQPGSTVSYAPDPTVSFTAYSDGRSDGVLSFQNIVIVDAASGKQLFTAGSLNVTGKHGAAADGRVPFESALSLVDLGIKNDDSQAGPFTLKFDVSGTRAVPAPGTAVADMDMDVHDLSLSSEKFTVTANGNVVRKADDLLPSGKLDVKIAHFAALRDGLGLSPDMKNTLTDAMQQITGAPVAADADEVDFALARPELGKFTIGNASFADIATLLLSHAMAGSAAPTPPPVSLTPPGAAGASAASAPTPEAPAVVAPTVPPASSPAAAPSH